MADSEIITPVLEPVTPIEPVEPVAVDPVEPAVVDPVEPVAVDPVEPVVKTPEDTIILKNKYEQLKNSQAGETRKNAELMAQVKELQEQKQAIITAQMSEEEKAKHELATLKEDLRLKDIEIARVQFLDKVKESCNNLVVKHELSPGDYDLIYSEDIEEMDKKAELLKVRDKKLIEDAMAKLRGSGTTGRPGEGTGSTDITKQFTNASEATATFRKIVAEQGKDAANKWWAQQKI